MGHETLQVGECYEYPLIIKKLLTTALTYATDQEIVYRDRFRCSYQQLNERIHRLAGGLGRLGIQAGDTVAVFDYDSNRYLESFFAIPMMGAVMQMVNWRLSANQLEYTINHAEARLIIVNSDFLPLLAQIRERLTWVEKIVVIIENEQVAESSLEICCDYEQLLADSADHYNFPDLDEHTKATTFYTTGTTGDPKGVHFSHRQLVLHTLSLALALGSYETIGRFRSDDVYMPLTPMFHVHAWGLPYVATMLATKQVYPGKYEPEMLLRLIVTEGVTASHCVPTILQMLVSSPAARQVDLSRWKVIIGGAKLSTGLAAAAQQLGIVVYTGYGMSETCPVISLSTPKTSMLGSLDDDALLNLVVKTGLPIPLVEFEVVDLDGQPLPHDGQTVGEIVFRAPWLTRDYFKSPAKTRDLWRDGWLHSGDVGHIDAAGYLQVTDRIKDVIKTGGEWISSLDLENCISRHPAVLEAAAIGVPDDKWGERPLLIVTLKPGQEEAVDSKGLQEFMADAAKQGLIPRYAVPDKILVVAELPKTSVGKLNKRMMRQEFG
ncbi:fatty acid--CoA ligase [Desulfofustis glycolicus]|uniref:Fatty-acyl-CoA synthase n=1 Tax=Desulfofustis glycolicus DSM 9705 TaxID=1121409 RepID=A0A1M5WFN0_9BACT|nr:fatty acid--CoA ligase [Desulfofustis glycolicus]MCB2217033.1 fatty acid--CoA ligase [Desulfobulbaceae bacterium]SHH86034.1 fatty-acyl-CoA synthase [Desulfofustis glycolicus DSM 9705]